MINMRPLSANSYALLLDLKCPGIHPDAPIAPGSQTDYLRCGTLWHFVHTMPVDTLTRSSIDELKAAAAAHGYSLPPHEAWNAFKVFTDSIVEMNAHLVTTDSEDFPAANATSQHSQTVSSGSESGTGMIQSMSVGIGPS